MGSNCPAILTPTFLILPKMGECSYRQQASLHSPQLLLQPRIQRQVHTCICFTGQGRSSTKLLCIHRHKTRARKNKYQTVTSVGSPLHPSFFQGITQNVHGLLASVIKSFTSCTPDLRNNTVLLTADLKVNTFCTVS